MSLPSKTFCILPWVHFFHSPNGAIQPCCAAKSDPEFGYLTDFDSAEEIINTSAMRQVRQDMLAGCEPQACATCYREESLGINSFRTSKNSDIVGIDVDKLVNNTSADGTLHNFKMQYWDCRFSNVCNLKCRMCSVEYSNTWGDDAVKLSGDPSKKDYVVRANGTDDWNTVINRYGDLSCLREIYFAGGESLFQHEHWLMLDHLDQLGMHDVKITYTTNLSRLGFGKYRLEEYLQRFTNVLFIVSLDAVGALAEYIRSGMKWDQVVKNIQTVQTFKGVQLKFNVVVSIYNILHLAEFFDFAYGATQNLDPMDLSMCHDPSTQNITTLPTDLKDLARDRLLSSTHYSDLKAKIDGVINYMYQDPVATWEKVMRTTNQLDRIRQENVLDVVPEFAPFWNSNL